jgi:hypothetical protein
MLGALSLAVAMACATAATLAGCGSGDDNSVPPGDAGGAEATPPTDGSTGDATTSDGPGGEGAPGTGTHGVPIASIPNQPIDFSLVPCGTSAPPQTLTVSNTGTGPLAVSAMTPGNVFNVSPTTVSVPPGGMTNLTVSATVSGASTAGTPIAGTLNIFTNDPHHLSTFLPLSVTPAGPQLRLTTRATLDFPTTKVGVADPPQSFTVINTGNGPATLLVSQPGDPQFQLVNPPDAGAVTLAAGDMTGWSGTVVFTPTSPPRKTTTPMGLSLSGPKCAETLVPTVTLTGQGVLGNVTGFPSTIDFGPVPCGSAPADKSITLQNSGTVDVLVTGVTFSGAPGFTADTHGGRIAPNGALTVVFHAPPVPASSTLAAISATASITTDAEMTPHTIALQEEPQGAILTFDVPQTPLFGSFGKVVLLQSSTQTFNVTNKGNVTAHVTLSTASGGADAGAGDAGLDAAADATLGGPPHGPFLLSSTSLTLDPTNNNGSQADTVTFEPIAANGTSAMLVLATTDPVCGAIPAPLPLSGFGVGGGPSLDHTALAFAATCGGPAPEPQQFTVTNNGTLDLTWKLTLGTDVRLDPGDAGHDAGDAGDAGDGGEAAAGPVARFTVSANPPPGLLAPGASSTVTVTAPAIPPQVAITDPAAYSAQVTITTDVPFDTPHVVVLSEPPLGDQLSFSVPGLQFGNFPVGVTTLPETFAVVNNANQGSPAANVTLVVTNLGDGGAAYMLTPTSFANIGAVASSQNASVTFDPGAPITYPASIAIQTTDNLCTALPSPLQLIGTGTAGNVAVTPATVAFGTDPADPKGLVTCGATGPAHTITVANTGNQAFAIKEVSLAAGASSPFVLSGPATTLPTLPIGGSTTVTVTPNAIPKTVLTPDKTSFADALHITTDATGDPVHTVNLIMQAKGAVIADTPLSTSWSFGTIGFGSIGTFTSTIQNQGNAAALVELDGLAQPTIFGLQNNPTQALPNAFTPIVGQFTPSTSNGIWSDQGTLKVTAPDGLCGPLPAAWTTPLITLSGSSNSNAPIAVSGTLGFPATECGSAAPAAQNITLTNNTNRPHTYALKFSSGKYYKIVDPGPGVVPATGTAIFAVQPNTIAPGPGVLPGASPYADNLVITVNDGGPDAGAPDAGVPPVASFTLPITWTLNGAVLTLPQGAGPRMDGHGNPFYPADSTGNFALPMLNQGNEAVTVNLGTSGPFSLSTMASVNLPTNISQAPGLIGASSPACPSTAPAGPNGTITFTYGLPNKPPPVCQPFPFSTVNVFGCGGNL